MTLSSPLTHFGLKAILASVRNKGPSVFFSTFMGHIRNHCDTPGYTFNYLPSFCTCLWVWLFEISNKIFKSFNEINSWLSEIWGHTTATTFWRHQESWKSTVLTFSKGRDLLTSQEGYSKIICIGLWSKLSSSRMSQGAGCLQTNFKSDEGLHKALCYWGKDGESAIDLRFLLQCYHKWV